MEKLKFLSITAVAVAFSAGFVSCSDDDDDGGSIPSGPVATYAGKLVSKAGAITLSYDAYGRCVSEGYDTYSGETNVIDYSKGLMTNLGEDVPYNVTFNSKGYITGMSVKFDFSEDGDSYSGSGTISFSYDGNGHLTGYTGNSSESGVENGVHYSYTSNFKCIKTWQNGNLTKVNYEINGNENGDQLMETMEAEFEYGNIQNSLGQYCIALAEAGHDLGCAPFALAGMFGTPSAYFPTSYTESWDNGKGYHGSQKYDCTITLNADGTIAKEGYNAYSYITASTISAAKIPASVFGAHPENAGKKIRSTFMPMRTRKTVK